MAPLDATKIRYSNKLNCVPGFPALAVSGIVVSCIELEVSAIVDSDSTRRFTHFVFGLFRIFHTRFN
jgi:hypothetical protein